MKGMFKIDYHGVPVIEKNFINQLLRMASGDVLECKNEECCLVFSLKGKEHIIDYLDTPSLRTQPIKVTECDKSDFSSKEIQDFFERMEKALENLNLLTSVHHKK